MKDLKEEKSITFVHPNGDIWFDLTERAKKVYDYRIRMKLGDNNSIHKLKHDETT